VGLVCCGLGVSVRGRTPPQGSHPGVICVFGGGGVMERDQGHQ